MVKNNLITTNLIGQELTGGNTKYESAVLVETPPPN